MSQLAHGAKLCVTMRICRYDTGFDIAGKRFYGRIVALMAADMLLGDEQRWLGLSANGTAAFLHAGAPRMIVLSRMELSDSIEHCCNMTLNYACHDAFMFRSPLLSGVQMTKFNFQQNIWQVSTRAALGN